MISFRYRGTVKRLQLTQRITEDKLSRMLNQLFNVKGAVLGFRSESGTTLTYAGEYYDTESFCRQIKERIEQGELVDEICASILPDWRAQNICPEGPFSSEQERTLLAMVRASAAA